MQFISQYLKNRVSLHALAFGLVLASSMANADELSVVIENPVQPLTDVEIQQGLVDMRNKMNGRIDAWGSKLTRADFERKRGKLVLKAVKQQEVCNIFQGVIDETYLAAQKNKLRLTPKDQKMLEHRESFVEVLGIQNNVIPTQLGFDCRVK